MHPKTKSILTLTILLLTATLFTTCSSDNTQDKQNPQHSLVNTPPVAKELNTTLNENESTDIKLEATDVDSENLTYHIVQNPSKGKIGGTPPNITYIPNKDYFGKDSFTYVAMDDKKAASKETNIELIIIQTAKVKSLELDIESLSLNKDTNTTFALTPTLSRGKVTQTLKEAIANPEFIVTPEDAITIDLKTKTITALKDTNVTIQAKIANTLSSTANLNIYWEVNGHRLPPEPDPKVNNATLLGVDSNNNGVRDDVERWIYEKYKDKHPIYITIMNQAALAAKEILLHPKDEGRRQINETTKVLGCSDYYYSVADWFGDKKLMDEDIDFPYFWHAVYFNTQARNQQLELMSLAASGGVFKSVPEKEEKQLCSEEVLKVAK